MDNKTGIYKRESVLFKLIVWTIIFTFTWNQVVWSADISSLSREEEKYVENKGFEAIEHIKQMKHQQDLMRRKAMVEYNRTLSVNQAQFDVNKNLYTAQSDNFFATMQMHEQIWKARNLMQHAGVSYVKYPDGKEVYSQAGMTIAVLNEKIEDQFGREIIRDTYDMKYDQKGLLTSYNAKVKDHRGNLTYINWHNAAYTPDSVFYATDETNAVKLITGYTEVSTDPLGNITTKVLSDIQYSGRDMSSYREDFTDSLGNLTTTWRNNISWDGENMVSYNDKKIDPLGNISYTDWNGSYSDDNLMSYHQVDTDIFGNATMTDFSDAVYDSNNQLISSHKVVADANGYAVITDFLEAEYNSLGDLISYRELTSDSIGTFMRKDWSNAEYDQYGRLLSYSESLTDSE
ncbi:MAG: hypothetical protein ABIB11_05995, partial [Candidatus Omnitrophota bacterium]